MLAFFVHHDVEAHVIAQNILTIDYENENAYNCLWKGKILKVTSLMMMMLVGE